MPAPGAITLLRTGSVSAAPNYPYKLSFASLGTYTTGGIAVKALIEAAIGRALRITDIIGGRSFSGTYYTLTYDETNDLLQAWDVAGAEVANTTNLTGSFRMLVIGT